MTRHLLQLLQFGDTREVPVGSLDVLGETHDVVGVAVPPCTHHPVQHELVVAGGGRVADEEQASVPGQGTEGHGLANDLKRLGLLERVACETEDKWVKFERHA